MENLISRGKSELKAFFFLISLVLILNSCQHNEIYYEFKELDNNQWNTDSILSFILDSTLISSDKQYDISIELIYNSSYTYRDLWVEVSHNLLNDSIRSEEVKQYFLADEDGCWLGNGFGSLYQITLPFKNNIHLDNNRVYTFTLRNKMKEDVLKGVEKVGLKILEEK